LKQRDDETVCQRGTVFDWLVSLYVYRIATKLVNYIHNDGDGDLAWLLDKMIKFQDRSE